MMDNQNQMQGSDMQQNMTGGAMSQQRGAHELFDADEAIGCIVGMMEQYQLYDQHIQDQNLKDILQRQSSFLTQLYNTAVESYQTGQDPQVPTQQYKMQENNDVTYGLSAGQPKQPKMSVNELTDECFSSFMLGQTKAAASALTMAAAEVNNPVLRRVFADSVPNLIEMAYELFLYQNKNGYYQVPLLNAQDTNIMLQNFSKLPQQGLH